MPPEAAADSLAHRRGLELHAWFNPFRAMYGGGKVEKFELELRFRQ